MILGVLTPTAGEIHFDSAPLSPVRSASERRAIQLVQQNPLSALNPKRSVGASVRLGLDTYGIGARSDRWRLVESAIESVGLPPDMRHRAPAALSGGQRQRIGIARALASDPRVPTHSRRKAASQAPTRPPQLAGSAFAGATR